MKEGHTTDKVCDSFIATHRSLRMSYRRVTYEDRLAIKSFLDMGLNQSQIAINLGFHKSTISREYSRFQSTSAIHIHHQKEVALKTGSEH